MHIVTSGRLKSHQCRHVQHVLIVQPPTIGSQPIGFYLEALTSINLQLTLHEDHRDILLDFSPGPLGFPLQEGTPAQVFAALYLQEHNDNMKTKLNTCHLNLYLMGIFCCTVKLQWSKPIWSNTKMA